MNSLLVLMLVGYAAVNASFIRRGEAGDPTAEEDAPSMRRSAEDDSSGEEIQLRDVVRESRRIIHRMGPKGRRAPERRNSYAKRVPSSCTPKYQNAPAPSTMCEYEDGPGIRDVGVSGQDRQGILDLHNKKRSDVKPAATNMQMMYWDDEIAVIAQKWASTCVPAHDEGWNRRVPNYHIGIGQNWAGGFLNWNDVIEAWHDEVKDFTYGAENNLGLVGHYTQIVGAVAGKVGCGYAYCPENVNPENYVCNYAYGQTDINHPFNAGQSCGDCQSNCKNGLCDCRGKICKNGGTLDVGTCQCKCTEQASGAECENLKCPSVEGYPCGTAPYDETACKKFATFPSTCPIMCGVCEDKCPGMTPEDCKNDGEVGPNCKCQCKGGFAGEHCEKFASCKADEDYCGLPYPDGYPKDYCTKYANIPDECPHMCGMC